MKKIFIIFLLIFCFPFLFSSCKNGFIGWEPQECVLHTGETLTSFCETVKLDPNRSSYLCSIAEEKGYDLCSAYRIIEIAAKEGILVKGYTEDQFNSWADRGIRLVKSGVNIGDIKDYLTAQLTKINAIAGAQIMIFGDMFVQLPAYQIISPDDAILLEAVFIDLKSEVHRMALFVQ